MADLWDDILGGLGTVGSGLGSIVGSNAFQNLTGAAAAGYDIYSGLQQQQQADRMYDLMFGSAAKQDEWAAKMAARTESKYWPLEDLQYQYATEDMGALRPSDTANRDYNIQRRGEQLAQARAINPMLDTTERNLLDTLTESSDDLRNRLSNQAVAGVQQSFDNTRAQDMRRMALSGINPSSGASLDYNRGLATSQAMAEANARTQAATTAEDTALSRQGQALAYRAGIQLPTYQATPSVSAGQVSTSLGSTGSLAAGAANNLNNQAQQSFTGAATALNSMYMRPYTQNYLSKISGLPTSR
jgi:hypothetical protein